MIKAIKKYKDLVFLLVLAVVARFLFLGLRPFDGDEGVILLAARAANFHELFATAARDVQPPLLHIFEFFTLKIFTFSEFSARLVPALAGILVIIPIYLVFERISNRKIAFFVSLASVFSAVLGYHSAELRPYGFFTLIFFWQFYFFLLVIKKPNLLRTIVFSVFTLALILTQYIGFVLIFGELLYVILRSRKSISWQNFLAVVLPFVAFGLIWGKIFVNQVVGRAGEQSQALNLKANISGLINAVYRFGAGRLFLDLDPSPSKNLLFLKQQPVLFVAFVLSLVVTVILFVGGLIILYRKQREIFYLLLIVFAPIILAAAVSSEIGPRSARYLSFTAPFYFFVAINYLYERKKTIFNLSLAFVFGAFLLSSFVNQIYFERTRPGVDKIAEYLRNNAKDSDALVIIGGYGGGEELVARYYLKETAEILKIYDIYGDYSVGNLDEVKARKPADFAKTAFDKSSRVWLYDFTYRVKGADFSYGDVKEISLGKDKENKEIILYEIAKK